MAKRRAEDPPLLQLHDSPSKIRHRSLCTVDKRQEGLRPPSPLPGNRCRKRPYHFSTCPEQKHEEADLYLYCETTRCDDTSDVTCGEVKHAGDVLTLQTPGTVQDRSSLTSDSTRNKRPREDCTDPETVLPKPTDMTADGDSSTEDCAYNSFQYWRVPLPELDLSLLEDVNSHSCMEQRSKVGHSSTQCEHQQANMMNM